MKAFVAVLRDFALLIARVVLGAIMVLHGWQRWQIEGIAHQVEVFQRAGVPAAPAFAWGTTIVELAGGVLLAFGLGTPLVAAVFLLEAILSIVFIRWRQGPLLSNQGYEYAALTGAMALVLTVFGGGRAAVDRLFRRDAAHDELRYDVDDPA